MPVPKLSELIYTFKQECESRGWETSEHEDWVKVNNEYHNFLWARTVHPGTFKKIAEEHKCAVRRGADYEVVNVNYIAWLFSETPPHEIMWETEENPELLKCTAIYDMSWANSEDSVCVRVNQTHSQVFRAFESFLESKWGVRFRSVKDLLSKQI